MNKYNNYLICDVENNNTNQYQQKAGNFLLDDLVAIGLNNGTEVYSHYIYPNKLTKLDLDGVDLLVGFNISHDLLFLWGLEDLQSFFKRGGRIWDCQYVEYVITGQQHTYPSLRDIAVLKYGCKGRIKWIDKLLFNKKESLKELHSLLGQEDESQKLKVDVKLNIQSQISLIEHYIQVSDLPKELVLEDVEGDVKDTETVYLRQLDQVKRLGLFEHLDLQMDAILATCEMKFNGIYIDQQVLQQNKTLLETELEKEYKKLESTVEKYWRFE